ERFTPIVPKGRVVGLATGEGWLYLTDAEGRTVSRVRIEGGIPEVLHEGAPLVGPADVALSVDPYGKEAPVLYVADPGARKLFQMRLPGKQSKPEMVELRRGLGPRLFLAVTRETLVVSDTEQDALLRIERSPGRAEPRVEVLQETVPRKRERGSSSEPRLSYKGAGASEEEYPRIDHPGPIGAHAGIIYAFSESRQQMYCTPRKVRRPVRINFSRPPIAPLGRVLVTDEWLYGLGD